jgi:cytochrome b561
MGYSPAADLWIEPLHNVHTLSVGMTLSAVLIRIYMALNGINGVPLVHLLRAKNITEGAVALAHIALCSALLLTMTSDIYLLLASDAAQWVRELRNGTQPLFTVMIMLHIAFVVYLNIVKKKGSLRRLLLASNAH